MVGRFHGMLYLSAEHSRSPGRRENHFIKRRFGEPFECPVIPFWAMVEHHPTSSRDQSKLHHFGRKVLPGKFRGFASIAGGIWKGDILVADMEDLENMDASEIRARRINAKEELTPQKRKHKIFPVTDGTANCSEETANSEGGNNL